MTDFKDDEQSAQQQKSFKEQILAELEKANQIRKEKEEELYQKELEAKEAARRTAHLYAEYKRQEALQKEEAQSPNDLVVDSYLTSSDQFSDERVSDEEILEAVVTPAIMPEVAEESKRYTQDQPDEELVRQREAVLDESFEEGDSVKKRIRKRQETDRMAKKISTILISSIIVALLAIGLAGTIYVYSAINPVDKRNNEFVQVEIPSGSGNRLIGQILQKEGLIKNSTVFSFYTKFKNFTNFQSGYYNLQKSMSLEEIATALQEGGTAEPTKLAVGKILIPEGYTIKQIASAIEVNSKAHHKKGQTPFDSKAFLKLVSDDGFIQEMVKKYPRLLSNIPSKEVAVYQLEGYLFPATYNYYKETELRDLVEEMIAATDANLSPYYDAIAASGKSVNEVLTLASLVEKEGSTDDDRRSIASVFYNRLNNDLALQSNIAILYAMGKLGEKTTLAEDAAIDTTINSPYNIYTNTGLMPGPVDSAGISAIEATINPASTDYLYFVANVHTGEVYYAKTFEEHSANVEKYVNSQIQ
ncbi:YceG family protein [Streptococcus ictaluri 707-05]|uniref:Endolytic murein transglycosylase n=1 Tax=Streptococcus ictaluri 707-05 TaxID=764299 RepID=G5K1D4_9STRE|nr:YceG family protein [Streptococcus ictaluri 707-05]